MSWQERDAAANKILAQNPDDKNALFAQVLANGLRGDYTAMIEKRNIASLSYMKTSRPIAQKLLASIRPAMTRTSRSAWRTIFWE